MRKFRAVKTQEKLVIMQVFWLHVFQRLHGGEKNILSHTNTHIYSKSYDLTLSQTYHLMYLFISLHTTRCDWRMIWRKWRKTMN